MGCLVLLPGTKGRGTSGPAGVGRGSRGISAPSTSSHWSSGDSSVGANVGSLGVGAGNWHGLGHSHLANSWDGDSSPGNGWGRGVTDGAGGNGWGGVVGRNGG